jgi:hypothetical protein
LRTHTRSIAESLSSTAGCSGLGICQWFHFYCAVGTSSSAKAAAPAALSIEDHAPPHFARYFDFFRYAAERLEPAALDAKATVTAVVQVSLSNKMGAGVFFIAVESGGGPQRETAAGAAVAEAE